MCHLHFNRGSMCAVFNRSLLDRVIDIAIQCLRHCLTDTSTQASSLPSHTCHGSALSADHLCSAGDVSSLLLPQRQPAIQSQLWSQICQSGARMMLSNTLSVASLLWGIGQAMLLLALVVVHPCWWLSAILMSAHILVNNQHCLSHGPETTN